jgi:hypothetical protein
MVALEARNYPGLGQELDPKDLSGPSRLKDLRVC